MKKRYLLLSFLLLLACFSLVSRSGGPGTLLQQQATGAPGETTCANCHFGGQGGGALSIHAPGLSGGVQPGRTYPLEVILEDADGVVGGMQMVALDANLQSVGTFTAPQGMQTVTISGRQYVEHGTPQLFDFTASPASATWQIDWTAPASAQGQVTFYAAAVAADWTGGNDNDDVYTAQVSLATLPVEWLSFSAQALPVGRIQLDWTTARELNSEYFEVQRSVDERLFEPVGFVAAQGHSEAPAAYRFEETVPFMGHKYHYRLKQVDQDGKHQFSEIASVWVPHSGFEVARVYPNPALHQEQVKVEILLPKEGPVTLRLRAIDGRVWAGHTATFPAGLQVWELPTAHLPSGNYYLEAIMGQDSHTRRLVLAN